MKVAYFDCTFGAAGDMLCATLLANGLDEAAWLAELQKIVIPDEHFEVVIEDVIRCAIVSKKVHVKCFTDGAEHKHSNGNDHHHHDHQHDHDHDHHHHHEHQHDHEHGEHAHRGIKEIRSIIDKSGISERAKHLALAIFQNLALSESRVHGIDPEEVHFHEVGAVDAIVDIVGFAIGYDLLSIDKSVVSPLTLGNGVVHAAHGMYPVPGPAVLYLIEKAGAPTTSLDLPYECLTPTGAAILTTIAERWGASPAFDKLYSAGYGAGTFNPTTHPNVTRAFIGECSDLSKARVQAGSENHQVQSFSVEQLEGMKFSSEVVAVIEANIDDCPPNVLAYALEKALVEGALDISVLPATMKKGRSGHLITIISRPEDRRRLEQLMLVETSTIGVRTHFVERLVAEREFTEVKLTDSCSVRVKVARDKDGKVINVQPEHADCVAFAQESGMPLKEVFEKALKKFANS